MKTNRILSVLLILSIAFSVCIFATADNLDALKLGDTNGDGKINAGDALEILQYAVGSRTQFSAQVTSSDIDNNGGGSGDIVHPENLKFTTEAELRNWLLNGDDATADRHSDVLSILASGNTITYSRPTIAADHDIYSLQSIEVQTNRSILTYNYSVNGAPDDYLLQIFVYPDGDNGDQRAYEIAKEAFQANEAHVYHVLANGIDYYYIHNESVDDDAALIFWQQYGTYHSAALDGNDDYLDETIELLSLEQVTIRTDAVTQ